MASVAFASGERASIQVFVGGAPQKESQDVKNWSIKRNVTKINDGVCGANRDELDAITNYYEFSCDAYNRTFALFDRLLADQANDDGGGAPTEKAITIVLKPKDGSKKGYLLQDQVTFDDWDVGAGGRTDRIMTKLPMRAQNCKPVTV